MSPETRRPRSLEWYEEAIWADVVAMSPLMFVVLVADKPAVMAQFVVPLIVAVPTVFLLFLVLRATIAVSRMLRAAPRRQRCTFPVKL
jgi:hypothetical protein